MGSHGHQQILINSVKSTDVNFPVTQRSLRNATPQFPFSKWVAGFFCDIQLCLKLLLLWWIIMIFKSFFPLWIYAKYLNRISPVFILISHSSNRSSHVSWICGGQRFWYSRITDCDKNLSRYRTIAMVLITQGWIWKQYVNSLPKFCLTQSPLHCYVGIGIGSILLTADKERKHNFIKILTP